jgi:hypothetical protein
MKTQTQESFDLLHSNFSQIRMVGEAAVTPIHIDLAIYDLMADSKKRTVNDVVKELTPLGYMRDDINRRMVVMLHKRNVFTAAQGGKGKCLYELKKGAKRPISAAPVKPSEIVVKPMAETPFKDTASQTTAVEVRYKKTRSFNQENIMQAQNTQQQLGVQPTLGYCTEDYVTSPAPAEYVVERTDHVRLALWKVMNDLKPYKYSELCTLLDHVQSGTITYHLRRMVDLNMVTVDRTDAKSHVYQLVEGTPMPEGLPPYEPNTPVTPPAAAPEQLNLKENPVQDKNDNGADRGAGMYPVVEPDSGKEVLGVTGTDGEQGGAVEATTKPADDLQNVRTRMAEEATKVFAPEQKAVDVPLFETAGIKIKGQHFSYKEARELLAELKLFGYGRSGGLAAHPLTKYVRVKDTLTIGEIEFTPGQANDIALMLIDELE